MLTQDERQHLDPSAIERLRAALHGELVTPNDAGYDQARRVWNAHIDKQPALIARCAGESEPASQAAGSKAARKAAR